jgi:hypothetical protein
VFQTAEVVPKEVFVGILDKIGRLRY